LLQTKHPTNNDQWEEGSKRDSSLWQELYAYPRPSSWVLRDCTHAVEVTYILLSKGQYACRTSKAETRVSYEE
jgi:hypothetical protein